MNKFICLLATVLACVSIANGLSLRLAGSEYSYELEMEFFPDIENGGDIRFVAELPNKLGWPRTTASVCFVTGYDGCVKTGDFAFAIRYWCSACKCYYNYQLGADFSIGHAIREGHKIYFDGENAIDLNMYLTNTGPAEAGNGCNPDTNYHLPGCYWDQFAFNNNDDFAYEKDVGIYCYTAHNANFWDTNFLTKVRVDQWYKQQAELEWTYPL